MPLPLLPLSTDELLTTTRTVRKRLDFSRDVEPTVIEECAEIAQQAPNGGNQQTWHFVVVRDLSHRVQIANYYRRAWDAYVPIATAGYAGTPWAAHNAATADPNEVPARTRQRSSSQYLADNLHRAPVLVIPCMSGRPEGQPAWMAASMWGSALPAAWSFMLAARARGLGTAWTTLHLMYEQDVAQLLGIPVADITQVALIPLAYTLGTDFKPGPRRSLQTLIHWDRW